MLNRLFRTTPGDGASLVAPRARHHIFKCVAADFLTPNGQFGTLSLFVGTWRRWCHPSTEGWRERHPQFRVLRVGPIAVAYGIEFHPAGWVPPTPWHHATPEADR